MHIKGSIGCREHGEFKQAMQVHLKGSGCPKCANITRARTKISSIHSFLSLAKIKHKDTYDYGQVSYVGPKVKVGIVCALHGMFNQTPAAHIAGQGCPACGNLASAEAKKNSTKTFIARSSITHKGFYDYTYSKYMGYHSDINITCPTHGMFTTKAGIHLAGSGCPKCSVSRYKINKPGMLYLLELEGGLYYKIGITNRSVEQRYTKKEQRSFTILYSKIFTNGQEAYDEEQRLLKKYKEYRYSGVSSLRDGYTELLTINILKDIKDDNIK